MAHSFWNGATIVSVCDEDRSVMSRLPTRLQIAIPRLPCGGLSCNPLPLASGDTTAFLALADVGGLSHPPHDPSHFR